MATSGDEQKNIVFWIYNYSCCIEGKEHYTWFRFEAAADEEIGSMVMLEDSVCSASYLEPSLIVGGVSVDRFIYVVGHAEEKIGLDVQDWLKRPSKHIYRLDTTNFEQGWKKLDAELIKERTNPHIVELDGKLYIFESMCYHARMPNRVPSEVYDPVEETIKLLPQETINTPDLVLLGVDHECKRVVFFSKMKGHLAFYSPYNDDDNNKWETKEIHHGDVVENMYRILHLIHAINHKTLYWVDGHNLLAYNFEYNMISGPVYLGFISNYTTVMVSRYECDSNSSVLFHMNGDRFCFFWYREQSIHVDSNNLYCTFLKISNSYVDGHFVLDVSELATHTYNIPSPARCFRINNIVPMLF